MEVTQTEFADMQGVSKARVSQWIKNRTISLENNGRIDPDIAKEELRRNLDHGRRLDWETSHHVVKDEGDEPPRPFTGSITRDVSIMVLRVFYDHYVNVMAPILLKVFRESCHIKQGSAEELTILFGCKTHEIIKDFLEEDLFDQWLKKNEGTSIDKLDAILSRGKVRRTLPPRDLPTMTHPDFILGLLKKQNQGDEKRKKRKEKKHYEK